VAEIIDLTHRLPGTDNLITLQPLEFRRGDWHAGRVLMCTKGESERFEAHRLEALHSPGHRHIAKVPNHFTLDGGYHYTVMGLFRYRSDEALMRRVYRLAGLMECVTNAPSPILRTDLLRRLYKSILDERDQLKVAWRGTVRHFLLPFHPEYHNPNLFLHGIATAGSLKELYTAIETETDDQFDVLSKLYVFYLPEGHIVRLD
jgi:hypothetical protein